MKIAAGMFLVLALPATCYAQDSLLGKYSGSYMGSSARSAAQGLTLEITSIDGETVKGVASRFSQSRSGGSGDCTGNYPMEGTIKGDQLVLRSTEKSGRAESCSTTLRLKVEGNKLAGTMNKSTATLSK